MAAKSISGFWRWFWIVLVGIVFGTIWYFIIMASVSSYYENEGDRLLYDQKYEEAIDAYDTSLKFEPENAVVYNSLGFTEYRLKHNDKAMKAYEKALSIDDENENVYYNIGTVYLEEKSYSKALESYEKVVELSPYYMNIYNTMGIVYSEMGNYQKAKEMFLKYLEVEPEDNYIAYNNIFELDLTNNKPTDEAFESEFFEKFSDDQEALISYEMLKGFKLISKGEQEDMRAWDEKYKDVSLGGWGYDEIDAWINKTEDEVIKSKLIEAQRLVKAHKND